MAYALPWTAGSQLLADLGPDPPSFGFWAQYRVFVSWKMPPLEQAVPFKKRADRAESSFNSVK